jgi:hypothetical protein
LIDAGAVVLLYVKSTSNGTVHSMPFDDTNSSDEKVNSYKAVATAGSIFVTHSTSINGTYEVPNNLNDITFRYIIVGPQTPEINARAIPLEELSTMAYEDVTTLLGIPQ